MHAVVQKIPGAHLTILGEGPDASRLQAQARRLSLDEKIDFRGFVQNPWVYMGNADLFVLPSRAEGLPNSLLEALALGTPVVASDCVDAMRELQSVDQRIVLFPPENPAAMADAIIAALSMPKETDVRHNAASQPNELFSPWRVAEQYSQLF
jgi:glycosyltransferase involved in cell wall biosynthesis